jgi:sialate O-acetylesterase
MQFGVSNSNHAEQEMAQAKFPQIRLFSVANRTAFAPVDDCTGKWLVCTPETVGGFSAVGYFFGRHLHQNLNVPVGLINTSWGGTIAEAWTSAEALQAKLPEFNDAIAEVRGPRDTFEKAMVDYKEKMKSFDVSLQKLYALEDDMAGAARRAAADLDDSTWKPMELPGNWEVRGMPDVDGCVWFRKVIEVPAGWAGKELILRPGPIDEVDVTWFNGVQVGAKGNCRTNDVRFWNVPREYHVPGNLVKTGKNVIAVRVFDCAGQGGFWGAPAEQMFVELADGSDKTHLSLAGTWKCDPELILPKRPGSPDTPNRPTLLFNAMIHPLIPYAIKGAIWYQGESNAGRAMQYRTLLPTLITDWRTRWGLGDFPFLVVQLANFMARGTQPEESDWAALREAQAMTTTALPNVGMALAIDIGDAKDIHPRNKQDVGMRLGLAARAIGYGQKIEFSGPVFNGMTLANGKAELSFTHTDGGLVVKGDTLTGFAVCGADRKFVWAKAQVQGDKIVVGADQVPQPVAVRYAWANNPECNLYNGAGLPAVPFRTDRP